MRKFKIHVCILISSILVTTCAYALDIERVTKKRFGSIQVVMLHGSHEQMGQQYGEALQSELKNVLYILQDFYTNKHGVSYESMKNQAELFYQRMPYSYQLFIQGVSRGSRLSLDDVKILNAMETLGRLIPHGSEASCAFISIPHDKTKNRSHLIGRNYDFGAPYDQISKYLTVTILREKNSIPTAFISLAGEIYCPTCVNANGLFMELNNGSPSGGRTIDQNRQSLLINMLQILQNSTNINQMDKQLNATQSDYSLIVNTADRELSHSFEFSSTLGMKSLSLSKEDTFVSTNFYQNPSWQNVPSPTDATTWLGVTRRNNLLNLIKENEQIDIPLLEKLMDKKIAEGGANWEITIYQLIFDTQDLSLYLKINSQGNNWDKIPLKELFNTDTKWIAS